MLSPAQRAAIEMLAHRRVLRRGKPSEDEGPQQNLYVGTAIPGRRHSPVHHFHSLLAPGRAFQSTPGTSRAAIEQDAAREPQIFPHR